MEKKHTIPISAITALIDHSSFSSQMFSWKFIREHPGGEENWTAEASLEADAVAAFNCLVLFVGCLYSYLDTC